MEQIDLGNNETIHMKKDRFGYRIVHPHKDQSGKIIWVNLLVGGWRNFFMLIFILFVLGCFFYGFKEVTNSCNDMAENPEKYFYCESGISKIETTGTRVMNYTQQQDQKKFMAGDYNDET